MKLIINERQYSLLVEQKLPKISDTREEIKKYCSPVKVSANIINSNLDKFINIEKFNIEFDKITKNYLSRSKEKDIQITSKFLNIQELINENKQIIRPKIVDLCRRYLLAVFGYSSTFKIGEEMEKIFKLSFDNLYKKLTDNLVYVGLAKLYVTEKNVDEIKNNFSRWITSISYKLKLQTESLILYAYESIVDEHDKTASLCKKAIVTKDENGKSLPKENQHYPRYPHYENTTLDYQYKSGPILKPLIGKVFDLLDSYS